jgi:hypothetical protein
MADADDDREKLLTEVRTLRARMEEIHVLGIPRHRWLKIFIGDLETNPHAQYRVHLYGVIYWLVNFPAVVALFLFAPGIWLKAGIFITLLYSLYANFATDYGAMSAAMAVYRPSGAMPAIPLNGRINGDPPALAGLLKENTLLTRQIKDQADLLQQMLAALNPDKQQER